MGAVAAKPLPPQLTLIDGGLDEEQSPDDRLRVELENAWIEVQVVGKDAAAFASATLDTVRRMQVAIAAGRAGMAGQLAHELELQAPLHSYRAGRSVTEAQMALEQLAKRPEPVA